MEESNAEKLLAQLEEAERRTSTDADVWNGRFILGIGIGNGFGLTSEIGLLQAAEDASSAAQHLLGPALAFVVGLGAASVAALVAGRAASDLSHSMFVQRHGLRLDEPFRTQLFDRSKVLSSRSQWLDRAMWVLAIMAAAAFCAGMVWTFLLVGCGVLGR